MTGYRELCSFPVASFIEVVDGMVYHLLNYKRIERTTYLEAKKINWL